MKPILLQLAGLHSYREMQEINFETLCEAGLFGIFGPTGSGKSTILDAITLALFGQVVRFGGGPHPKEVLNQLENRVFVSFTFEIGKQNERTRYRIEREFGLDKKGNRRQPEVRLIECKTGEDHVDVVLESKATTATAAIENLIGLTLQDFTRAVVLPQGQFSKFLTLKSSERNDMLQRMFYLYEYGEKLSDRIRQATEQNKAEIHRLQLELAALGDVGPEALQAASETLEAAEQQSKTYSQQREELFQKKREVEQLHQWQVELEAISKRLQSLAVEQMEIDLLAKKTKELEASLQLWPLREKQRELEDEWRRLDQSLLQQRVEHKETAEKFNMAEQTYQTAYARLRSEEPGLIEQKSKLAQAVEWEQELSSLQAELHNGEQELSTLHLHLDALTAQLAEDGQKLAHWEQELARLDEQLKEATVSPEQRSRINHLREAKRDWEREAGRQKELKVQFSAMQSEWQALGTETARLEEGLKKAVGEREQVEHALSVQQAQPAASEQELEWVRDELSQIKSLGKEWREQVNQQEDWRKKWTDCEQQWSQAEQATQAAAGELQKQEGLRDQAQIQLQQAREAWQNWQQSNMARHLRERLEDGEECPVCGSAHHPYRIAEHLNRKADDEAEAAAKWQEKLEKCEAAFTEAEQLVRAAAEKCQRVKIEQAGIEHRRTALLEEKKGIDGRIGAIQAECKALGDFWRAEQIDELLSSYRDAEDDFRMKLAEREQQKKELERKQDLLNQLREQEYAQKSAYQTKAELHKQLHEKITADQVRLQEAAEQTSAAEERLHQLRGELAVDAIETEYSRLEELDKRLVQLRNTRMELETNHKKHLLAYEANKEKRTQLTVRQAALQERLNERKQRWAEKHRLWLERTNGEPAGKKLDEAEAHLSRMRTEAIEAEESRSKAMASRQQAHERLVKTEETYAQVNRQRSDAELSLQRAMMQAGFERVEQLEQLYLEREHLTAYQERVKSFTTLLSQLQYDYQRLSQMLDGRSVTSEEHEEITQAWAELEHIFQAVKDQVAVARQTLTQINTNHEKWIALQERLTERTDEQSRLDELRKLFEAKAFVQFIAEEKLVSIARDASYHLKRMTKNRYVLEIGDEGEFVLRDEGAGGIRRPVSTLSGGETFLTSLALALALSVEIQMRGGRLEFFFLDEGFGTLDPELLEVVLDALERLRMDNFTIGVISHVPEMRLRMPRRLVITPAEPLGAGSRIELEMD